MTVDPVSLSYYLHRIQMLYLNCLGKGSLKIFISDDLSRLDDCNATSNHRPKRLGKVWAFRGQTWQEWKLVGGKGRSTYKNEYPQKSSERTSHMGMAYWFILTLLREGLSYSSINTARNAEFFLLWDKSQVHWWTLLISKVYERG